MNTANLQLEGLYLAVAAVNNLLVTKGIVSREEMHGAIEGAGLAALEDYRADELSPAHRDAMAFASRFLMLANSSASTEGTPVFSELARMVGKMKDQEPLVPQRAVGDEDPNYSPMDGFRPSARNAGSKPAGEDMPGAESIASARADEDTYD